MSNNQSTPPSLTILAGRKGNAQHSSESAEHYTLNSFAACLRILRQTQLELLKVQEERYQIQQELDEARARIQHLQQSLSQHALGLNEIPSTQVHQRIAGSGCLNERPERGLFRFIYYDGDKRKEVSFSNLCIALAGEVRRMIEDKWEARFIAQYVKDHRG